MVKSLSKVSGCASSWNHNVEFSFKITKRQSVSWLEREALQLLYSVSCLLYSYTYSILYSIGVGVKLKTFANKSYTISQMTKYLNSVNTFFLKPHMALLFCVVNILIS
jgi:hypothetical protein